MSISLKDAMREAGIKLSEGEGFLIQEFQIAKDFLENKGLGWIGTEFHRYEEALAQLENRTVKAGIQSTITHIETEVKDEVKDIEAKVGEFIRDPLTGLHFLKKKVKVSLDSGYVRPVVTEPDVAALAFLHDSDPHKLALQSEIEARAATVPIPEAPASENVSDVDEEEEEASQDEADAQEAERQAAAEAEVAKAAEAKAKAQAEAEAAAASKAAAEAKARADAEAAKAQVIAQLKTETKVEAKVEEVKTVSAPAPAPAPAPVKSDASVKKE